MWVTDNTRQNYYKTERSIKTVNRNQIIAICKCGFIELKPNGKFEEFNGGIVVKRSQVRIIGDGGEEVKKLRPRKGEKINKYYTCNACVNDWR